MPDALTVVFDPAAQKKHYATMSNGEALSFSVDADMWCTRIDPATPKTLTSAVWSVVEGSNVTAAADSEAANVSSSVITASDTGNALIKVVLTLSDSQIGVQYIHIKVPNEEGATSDYQ